VKTKDFDYNLPQSYIAQTPVEPRHSSRLLVLDRAGDTFEHSSFWKIDEYLKPGDVLVLNKTRVIPARIFARKETGGKVEVLLLNKQNDTEWEVIIGGKGLTPGKKLIFETNLSATIEKILSGPRRIVRFSQEVDSHLEKIGHTPLPPYIHTELDDPDRYQTIYAKDSGSAAAPTAGLHFTDDLMLKLQKRGVTFCMVTLHVGLDTFAPVNEEDPREHHIHSEWCELSEESADIINSAHKNGNRIIAVGTTSVRVLESAAKKAVTPKTVEPFSGRTELFILPGYQFKVVDAMVTNFHLPCSTLIMMVSAFAGRERILNSYQIAKELDYRFYSFGDAMLII